jgi:hypothetical protein
MEQVQVEKERKQSRYSKGVIIAASRRTIRVRGEDAWLIESESVDGRFYKVTASGKCECADSRYRGQICKHIYGIIRSATE